VQDGGVDRGGGGQTLVSTQQTKHPCCVSHHLSPVTYGSSFLKLLLGLG